jgi:hypothetical protein
MPNIISGVNPSGDYNKLFGRINKFFRRYLKKASKASSLCCPASLVSIHKWPFSRRAAFSAGFRLRRAQRTSSCPVKRGPQTFACPDTALSWRRRMRLVERSEIPSRGARRKKFAFLNLTLYGAIPKSWMGTSCYIMGSVRTNQEAACGSGRF